MWLRVLLGMSVGEENTVTPRSQLHKLLCLQQVVQQFPPWHPAPFSAGLQLFLWALGSLVQFLEVLGGFPLP